MDSFDPLLELKMKLAAETIIKFGKSIKKASHYVLA